MLPGLAEEWAKWDGQRPFVGALTMELTTGADEEVVTWIAAGTPPICFGFGSMPVESPADAIEMISSACAELGERALICAGWSNFSQRPACRPRQGGWRRELRRCLFRLSGGRPPRRLGHHGREPARRSSDPDPVDGRQSEVVGRLRQSIENGNLRRFSSTTRRSLVADLRRILAPEYATRARELAIRMTPPAESVAKAADVVEEYARSRHLA